MDSIFMSIPLLVKPVSGYGTGDIAQPFNAGQVRLR
jgi:hypothetical protein